MDETIKPAAWQRLVSHPEGAPHFYWEEISEWEAMNCTADKDRRPLYTADQLRAYGDAVRADEREKCARVCEELKFTQQGPTPDALHQRRLCAAAIRASAMPESDRFPKG